MGRRTEREPRTIVLLLKALDDNEKTNIYIDGVEHVALCVVC